MDEDLKILLLLNSLEGQGRKLWNAMENKEISVEHILKCETKPLASIGASESAIAEIRRKGDEKTFRVTYECVMK